MLDRQLASYDQGAALGCAASSTKYFGLALACALRKDLTPRKGSGALRRGGLWSRGHAYWALPFILLASVAMCMLAMPVVAGAVCSNNMSRSARFLRHLHAI